MASTALPRPLLSLLQAGSLLSLAATVAVAQTEFPHAAGTDSTGRAQAVSDAAGRVLIESPEFPHGLWVDLVDEVGQALAGIQVAYEGSPDSLVALHCIDPSGLRHETLLWTRSGGNPLRLALKPGESADLPAGLTPVDWRIDPRAAELLVLEEGLGLIGSEAVTALLEELRQSRTGRVVVQIDSRTTLAVNLADAEPVGRLADYLEDQARMSLGEVDDSVVQVLFDARTFESDLALFEGAIVLTTSLVLIQGSDLEEWVLRGALGRSQGPVPWSQAVALTHLYLSSKEIEDVSPLAALINLEELGLGFNQIVDVSPLAALTNLEELWLGFNQIVDIGPLAGLTRLERLSLRENPVLDVSPLAALTSLERLDLSHDHRGENKIEDVSPLSALTRLERLHLATNAIVDVSPLSALTNLEWLNLRSNAIENVSPLSALTRLEGLNLATNAIEDVSPLAVLTSLEGLILRSNRIEDVSPLSALTSLTELNLRSNQIVDVSPLGGLTSLEWLSLEKNQIQDISPLVANSGLGEGDRVLLYFNPLSEQAITEQIPALRERGVDVSY